jgi:hypothetical protein
MGTGTHSSHFTKVLFRPPPERGEGLEERGAQLGQRVFHLLRSDDIDASSRGLHGWAYGPANVLPGIFTLEVPMRFDAFSFGSIQINNIVYDHDVVIDRGAIRKRKKRASKKLRDNYGHTPLSAEEDIPWTCRRLVVGTGAHGRLPVTRDVRREAERRKIELLILPTVQAIDILARNMKETNAVLHVTC